jgi:enoyl-CoA hydratase/carnithine racemase
VPLRAGQLLANELLLLGEAFGPDTALRGGIANAVVAPGDLLAHAEAKARALAAKPPEALAATKRLLRRADVGGLRAHMTAEFDRFSELLRGPEAAEAVAAFQERRRPDFSKFHAKG